MSLRILTYKRTHIGDPDSIGQFGINDCMGRVRNRSFDAVIGVGGIGPEPRSVGIAGKLTWVGIGPRRAAGPRRGDILSFEHFLLLDTDGPDFRHVAPNLARRLFDGRVRALLTDYTDAEFKEALEVLEFARKLCGATPRACAPSVLHGICRKRCGEATGKRAEESFAQPVEVIVAGADMKRLREAYEGMCATDARAMLENVKTCVITRR